MVQGGVDNTGPTLIADAGELENQESLVMGV